MRFRFCCIVKNVLGEKKKRNGILEKKFIKLWLKKINVMNVTYLNLFIQAVLRHVLLSFI